MPVVDIACAGCGYEEEDALVSSASSLVCPDCQAELAAPVYATAGFTGILFPPEESSQLKQTFTSNANKREWMKANNVRLMGDEEISRQTYRSGEAADWQARRNGYRSTGAEAEARLNHNFVKRRGRLAVSETGPVTQRKHDDFLGKSKALKEETIARLSNHPEFN